MRFVVFALLVFLANPTFALSSAIHSCRIRIQLEKTNGEHQQVEFSSALKTREACQTLAKIHQKNFDPHKLKTKRVTYLWQKTTKNIPMLAKVSAKKHKKTKRKKF